MLPWGMVANDAGTSDSSVAAAAAALAALAGIDVHVLAMESLGSAPASVPGGASDGNGGCCICEAALRGHLPPVRADAAHRFAAYQAESLGGRYVYVCEVGMLHAASPVIRDDRLACTLVAGPAVLDSIDTEVVAAATSAGAGSLMSPSAVEAWLASVRILSPSEAAALAETLARVAASCCDREGAEYLAKADRAGPTTVPGYLGHLSSMEGVPAASRRYPVELDHQLTDLVATGNRDGAAEVLSGIESAIGSYDQASIDEARSRVLELVVLLSRAAIAGGADVEQVFGLEYRSLGRLRSLESVDEIVLWLRRILGRFLDLVFDLRHLRYTAHLSGVLRFIHDEYRNPITLSDAAAAVGLSAGYLSRIFRSELKTGFKTYLARVRMQEAKRLLRHSALSVGDIAERCGFSDHSYFTSTFRRATGASPTEYRLRGPA